MTTRRNFFQWAGGLLAAAFAPKLPTPQLTADTWSALDVVADYSADEWESVSGFFIPDIGEWVKIYSYDAKAKAYKLEIDYSGAEVDRRVNDNS